MKKQAFTFFLLASAISIAVSSCCAYKTMGQRVRNCTEDTLLIDVADYDTLVGWMYWDEYPEDAFRQISPKDTLTINVHETKTTIKTAHLIPPDSLLFFYGDIFEDRDIYYLHIIKWDVAKHYTLEEIRAKRLYGSMKVTKADFPNNIYEYRHEK